MQLCTNYADQLYWLTRDYRYGSSTLEAPLVGATFTNIDISWAHEFRDGAAFKITPFYRRGYNVIEQTAQIVGFNFQTGSPVFGDVSYSNLGIQKATGIETLYTKDVALGPLDAGRRNLHQPVRQRTTGHVLTAGGASRRRSLSLARPFALSDQRRIQLEDQPRLADQSGHLRQLRLSVWERLLHRRLLQRHSGDRSQHQPEHDLLADARLHRSARSGDLHQAQHRCNARDRRTRLAGRFLHDTARRRQHHHRVPAADARHRAIGLRPLDRQPVQRSSTTCRSTTAVTARR